MTTPDVLDAVYGALIASALLLDHLVLWRSFRRRCPTGSDGAGSDGADSGATGSSRTASSRIGLGRARLRLWWGWMGMLWSLVAAGAVLWWLEGRALEALRLVAPHGWRLWSAIGLVSALAAWYARTLAKVLRIPPSRRSGLRSQLGHLAVVLPHMRSELAWFVALSLSAGVCEELVFRGYLIWVFQPIVGLWGAAGLSIVVFALAHAYQGARGIVTTGIAGALFTAVVLVFGSLWPAIALHALVDAGQGVISWLVLRQPRARTWART